MSAKLEDIKVNVNEKIVENATCTFCGCVCDDITLTVDTEKKVITKSKVFSTVCLPYKRISFNMKKGRLIEIKY